MSRRGRAVAKCVEEAAAGVGRRVAGYIRISTDETNQPYSLEAQRKALELFVASQGWVLVRTYEDRISGAVLERPGLRELLDDGHRGDFDVVVAYRVDRLVRSMKVLMPLLDEMDAAGISFRSACRTVRWPVRDGLQVRQRHRRGQLDQRQEPTVPVLRVSIPNEIWFPSLCPSQVQR